jgi:hypothetical protein
LIDVEADSENREGHAITERLGFNEDSAQLGVFKDKVVGPLQFDA